MKPNTIYGNESITSLKGAERVRKRPGVIFGSDGLEGCQHAIFEILSNSIDEAREGYGTRIEVSHMADCSVAIRDYGRGIPVEYNVKEGRYNWELVFCELYAGGKFQNEREEGYAYSLGLNGLGLCATQYASAYMDVTIYRDGFRYALRFEKGENIGGLIKEPTDEMTTGTLTLWQPDRDVFTDIDVPLAYYESTLRRQAIVNAGLVFELSYTRKNGETTRQTYCYPNGIADYIAELSGDGALTAPVLLKNETAGRDRADKADYKLKYEIAFCFSNNVNALEYYHNSSFLEHGGSPEKAVKSAFVSAIDSLIKNSGQYKKNEKKVAFSDIEDSLILISSSFSTVTSYANQTKKAITNKFIQEDMTAFLKKRLQVYFIENKADADKIITQTLANKRSRETAEKTRLSIRKKLTGAVDIHNRVDKFVDCRTKDVSQREIYIVEGDSALGACKLGRDAQFQAIMPVRGKILNCLKADYDKIFNNDIITDLLKVLGCGAEVLGKGQKDTQAFDLSQLKWNKVIICTDADVDGFQIRTLILTMFYRLTPSLIDARKIFIAESPLYEIRSGKKTRFAYSDKEKNDIVRKLGGKAHIQRSKGLGENEPDMMWHTTMNPETRKLIQVEPEDVQKTRQMFDVLLGDNLKGRKAFIENFGHQYIDLAETI